MRAIIYLLGIIGAEFASVVLPGINPNFVILGTALYVILFIVMLVDAARLNRLYQGNLILSLTLVPLIRLLSLVLPLTQIPQILWYPAIYLPLLAAVVTVAYILEYKPSDIGITLRSWPLQLPVAVMGLGLGYMEYLILYPQPIVNSLTWNDAWLPSLLLFVSIGVVEELIFRGVIQKSAVDFWGTRGIVYVSIIFAILHMGWAVGPDAAELAWLDLFFVFAVSLLFGWIVKKTGSLLGVTLCHGAINVVLFVIAPLLFKA